MWKQVRGKGVKGRSQAKPEGVRKGTKQEERRQNKRGTKKVVHQWNELDRREPLPGIGLGLHEEKQEEKGEGDIRR